MTPSATEKEIGLSWTSLAPVTALMFWPIRRDVRFMMHLVGRSRKPLGQREGISVPDWMTLVPYKVRRAR